MTNNLFKILIVPSLLIAFNSNGAEPAEAPAANQISISADKQVGSEKPSVHFFEHCFTHIMDFKKEETLMVGDSLTSDIQGAIYAGIDSCYFNHVHNSAYAGTSVSKATYTIKELPELLQL